MVKYGKIYPVSFGFGWGIVSGLCLMLLCWMGARWGIGLALITLSGTVYHQVAATWIGGLWGFFWGFLHGFIFGFLTAAIYNCTCKCFCPTGSCDSNTCG